MLDILSALLFSPRGGSNVKLWAGKLLARCVCLRLASSPMRLLQATNHADLQDALPPIECFQLNLPETLHDEADDFITTLAITSASEGTIVVGTSQGMVRSIPRLIILNDKEFLGSCFSWFILFTNDISFWLLRSTSTTPWRRRGVRPFHFTRTTTSGCPPRAGIAPSPPSRSPPAVASSRPVAAES